MLNEDRQYHNNHGGVVTIEVT